jgi:hypothetical protein
MGAAASTLAPTLATGSSSKHARSQQQQQIRYRKQRGGRTTKTSRTMKVKKAKKNLDSHITDLSGSTMNKTRKNHS